MSFSLQFTEREYRLFGDFIHERWGLVLSPEKAPLLAMKLAPRLAVLGLSDFSAYLVNLKYGPDAPAECRRMISLVTNNETWFFREEPQLAAFTRLLDELRGRKLAAGDRRLRVLSAGCASGEEPYSLAMLVFENGGFFFDWDVKIVGMDADPAALERAEKGHFYPRSFRQMDPARLERHFTPNGAGLFIKPALRRFTEFTCGNLLDPADWQRLGRFDVIFCRNVLIYFSPEKIAAAVDRFHEALLPGGRLFLGHSETTRDGRFLPVYDSRAIIYRKADTEDAQ